MKYIQLVVWLTACFSAIAIQIRDCGQGTWGVEVKEKSGNDSIICEGVESADILEWFLNNGSGYVSLGACSPNGDCPTGNPHINMTRANKTTTSSFTFNNAQRQYGGYGVQCTASNQGANNRSASCTVNIIYGALKSATSCSSLTVHANRTLSGTCNITRVFSSAGYYACGLAYQSVSGTTLTTSNYSPQPVSGDNSYNSGLCSFNAALHSFSGTTAVFYIIVYPGALAIQRNVSLEPPSRPSITCSPSSWIPEGSTVSCRCSTSSLGHPQGLLQGFRGSTLVANASTGALNFTMPNQTMSKSDHGQSGGNLTCVVDWGQQDLTSDVHVVQIAWGPNVLRIPENTTFISGSGNLTLTCEATDFNPSNSLTYSWTGRCQGNSGRSCIFTPVPGVDDDISVTCTATNTYNNKAVQSEPYRLNLLNPPSGPPVITSSASVLYAGDVLSLTCAVKGGKPLVTSVTMACGSQYPDNPSDVKGTDDVSSSLQINLTSADDGLACNCTAAWAVTAYYILQNSTTLSVFYPPSNPVITRTDSLQYPYIEGDTVLMSCVVQSPGNPKANLTWFDQIKGHTLNSSETPAILVMTSVNRTYNQKALSCRADNSFTQAKGRILQDSWVLQVYYKPDVVIDAVTDVYPNQCSFMSNVSNCIVAEGQKIHFRCNASSNPLPANINLDFINGTGSSELLVEHVNHTLHTGIVTCTVTTGPGNQSNDQRLPLRGSGSVTVFVTYTADVREFSLLSQAHDLTVNETDRITMTCTAVGRPSPAMRIVSNTGHELNMTSEGPVSFVDTARLNHVIPNASCQDAGPYTCHAVNGNIPVSWQRLLRVNCKPQPAPSFTIRELTVNYEDSPIHMTLQLLAYPKNVQHTFVYLGHNKTLSVPSELDRLDLLCENGTLLYNAITCNITINNLDADSAGFYTLNIYNDFGSIDVQFKVTFGGIIKPKPETNNVIIGAVVGAIIGVGGAATVAVVIVLIIKRRRAATKRQTEQFVPVLNTRKTNTRKDCCVEIDNVAYVSANDTGATPIVPSVTNDYDVVEVNRSYPAGVVKISDEGPSAITVPTTSASPGKTKPEKRAKPRKTEHSKGTRKKKANKDVVYGNNLLTMNPDPFQTYENFALKAQEKEHSSHPETTECRTENQDGLVYTTLSFPKDQDRPAPRLRETTEYAEVDFKRTGPQLRE